MAKRQRASNLFEFLDNDKPRALWGYFFALVLVVFIMVGLIAGALAFLLSNVFLLLGLFVAIGSMIGFLLGSKDRVIIILGFVGGVVLIAVHYIIKAVM